LIQLDGPLNIPFGSLFDQRLWYRSLPLCASKGPLQSRVRERANAAIVMVFKIASWLTVPGSPSTWGRIEREVSPFGSGSIMLR
jgi:hypothetical protein